MTIEHDRPAAGGGWMSGPMIGGPHADTPLDPTAADRRPQYNPDVLLLDVARILEGVGIEVDLGGRHPVATVAAADLLSAMGVKPASAPTRPAA